MKLKLPTVMGITLVTYIFAFLGMQLLGKDKTFSELENRNLTTLPTFTTESFLNGKYGTDFETYVADQFPLRNTFISMKSYSELLLQKKDNNGVYIGKDDYFLQDFKTPDLELMKRNASYINQYAESHNTYVLIAPTATKILEDKLPSFAQPYDEGGYIHDLTSLLTSKVHVVDALETLLAHNQEDIYYKTDHHWTTLGAYYAYTAFCESADITPLSLDDFNIETVSQEFYGTLFSKGNFTFAQPDTLQIFRAKHANPLTVTYTATGTVTDSLYEMSHLDTKDKYSLFLDNNHPLITIKTGIQNDKKLMIIKDSYANCFVPFLVNDYEEIHILDLRLLNMPLATYATDHNITDTLLLYNVQNFSVEAKLSLLLK